MIFLAILVLLSALAIAGCAAYFSIVGLTLLFIGSSTSIIVMGCALELGKLVTVSFLHQCWEKVNLLLKTYLIVGSIVLSLITSVGIYGYLANGYNTTNLKIKNIEQNINSNDKIVSEIKKEIQRLLVVPDNTDEISLINTNKNKYIEQQFAAISQKEKRIGELQASIVLEKNKTSTELITAKNNLEEESKKELDQIKLYNDRLIILDKELQYWMEQGQGGLFKQNGLQKARETRTAQEKEREQIDNQIKLKQNNIDKLRTNYELKIKDLTNDLNNRIKSIEDKITNVEQEITKEKLSIDVYQNKISNEITNRDKLKDDAIAVNKNKIKEKELEIQQLEKLNSELQIKINETDVGTFKFVAKSIGVELDKTVNWFIWAIMFVFDPLAVTLIICFNHIIKNRKQKPLEIVIEPTTIPANTTTSTTTTTTQAPQPIKTETEAERLLRIMEEQRQERATRKGTN